MFLAYDQQGTENGPLYAVYTSGGLYVRVLANPADKASEQAAAITALQSAENSTPILQYTTAFLAQRKTIFNAFHAFHEGLRTAPQPPALADYRNVLSAAFTIILTLPAGFTTEITQEYKALGLADPANVAVFTLVQCQGWHQLLGSWLGRAMAGVAGAMISGLD